jgi:hypothetical protein
MYGIPKPLHPWRAQACVGGRPIPSLAWARRGVSWSGLIFRELAKLKGGARPGRGLCQGKPKEKRA